MQEPMRSAMIVVASLKVNDGYHQCHAAVCEAIIPLESDPPVLNDLMYGLGVSSCLALTDVWSIDDSVQLSSISRPVYALILVLPTCAEYERHRQSSKGPGAGAGEMKGEDILWIRQTIDNACGLYAILHATCNPGTRRFLGRWSIAIRKILN